MSRDLQEQPLLLEDLLEQEKQEQRRQQEQAMLQQKQEAGMLTGSRTYISLGSSLNF